MKDLLRQIKGVVITLAVIGAGSFIVGTAFGVGVITIVILFRMFVS